MSTVNLRDLRRRAADQGYTIWKVRSSTRESFEFGPYALITEDSQKLELHGVDIEDLAAFLYSDSLLGEAG
jgi:hypothetical protein